MTSTEQAARAKESNARLCANEVGDFPEAMACYLAALDDELRFAAKCNREEPGSYDAGPLHAARAAAELCRNEYRRRLARLERQLALELAREWCASADADTRQIGAALACGDYAPLAL